MTTCPIPPRYSGICAASSSPDDGLRGLADASANSYSLVLSEFDTGHFRERATHGVEERAVDFSVESISGS